MVFHSYESSLPVLTQGAICFSKFYKMKFENLVKICLWLDLAVKGLRVKILSNTNLLASRHIKREKSSLPVYARRSKTSLPTPP